MYKEERPVTRRKKVKLPSFIRAGPLLFISVNSLQSQDLH